METITVQADDLRYVLGGVFYGERTNSAAWRLRALLKGKPLPDDTWPKFRVYWERKHEIHSTYLHAIDVIDAYRYVKRCYELGKGWRFTVVAL